MKIERVQQSAYLRGLFFDGVKTWRNSWIGYAYEIYLPGRGFYQADTLAGIYCRIMEYKKNQIGGLYNVLCKLY